MARRDSLRQAIFTCERPRALSRCLAQLLASGAGPLAIYDDSRRAPALRKNRALIADLARRFRRPIDHVDRDARRHLAARLARATGVPEAVVEFGLLGNGSATTTIGANRNAMLLLSAPGPTLCSDDDVVPRLAALPFGRQPGIWLGPMPPRPRSRLCASHRDALAQAEWLEQAPTEIHRGVLGHQVHEVIGGRRAGPIDAAALGPELARCIDAGHARIVVSATGVVGDHYASSPAWNLARDDGAIRLAGSAQTYRRACVSSHLVEGVTQLAIARAAVAPFFHVGLDLRELLPPFVPVGRREDGVFMTMLRLCRADAWQATSPVAVEHTRVDRRRFERADLWREIARVSLADILWSVFAELERQPPAGAIADAPAPALDRLGRAIAEAGSGSPRAFADRMAAASERILDRRAAGLEQLLGRHPGAPDYWTTDIRRQMARIRASAARAHRALPVDLLPGATRRERELALRDTLVRFGELVCAWPELWQAARKLRQSAGRGGG